MELRGVVLIIGLVFSLQLLFVNNTSGQGSPNNGILPSVALVYKYVRGVYSICTATAVNASGVEGSDRINLFPFPPDSFKRHVRPYGRFLILVTSGQCIRQGLMGGNDIFNVTFVQTPGYTFDATNRFVINVIVPPAPGSTARFVYQARGFTQFDIMNSSSVDVGFLAINTVGLHHHDPIFLLQVLQMPSVNFTRNHVYPQSLPETDTLITSGYGITNGVLSPNTNGDSPSDLVNLIPYYTGKRYTGITESYRSGNFIMGTLDESSYDSHTGTPAIVQPLNTVVGIRITYTIRPQNTCKYLRLDTLEVIKSLSQFFYSFTA